MERYHQEIVMNKNIKSADFSAQSGEGIADSISNGGAFFQHYLRWMIFTNQPISTCENELFRRMCAELNPKAKAFDRH